MARDRPIADMPERRRVEPADDGYESPDEDRSPELGTEGHFWARRQVNGSESGNHMSRSNTDSPIVGNEPERRDVEVDDQKRYGIRDRIGCFTWTWFTMTMATGGIANVLHSVPYRSDWLYGLGVAFMILNMILFVMNCIVLGIRFMLVPGSFSSSFTTQTESLFIPASIVSIATILTNIAQYGVEKQGVWLQSTMAGLFWAYAAASMVASCGIYLVLWSTQSFPIQNMTPIWIFPAYPLLVVAPFAANLVNSLPAAGAADHINPAAIAFAAIMLQGTGFLVSLNIYGAFIYRLMTQKLPRDTLKPGMFVSVGPSGFTAAGLILMGNALTTKVFPNGYMDIPNGAVFLKLVLDLVGLWLWGICIWFFFVSVGAHWQILWPKNHEHQLPFNMTWYSFVFPNTALVTATQAIGTRFDSNAIHVVGTVMAGMLVVVWVIVFFMMIRALYLKRLLWPEQVVKRANN